MDLDFQHILDPEGTFSVLPVNVAPDQTRLRVQSPSGFELRLLPLCHGAFGLRLSFRTD